MAMANRSVGVVFGLLFGLGALVASVEPAEAQAKKSAGGIIRLEETVIEGRVQKPNAFFINTRQAMVYEVMELRESFVGEIPKAIEGGKF
jgi:hypothetical protein